VALVDAPEELELSDEDFELSEEDEELDPDDPDEAEDAAGSLVELLPRLSVR